MLHKITFGLLILVTISAYGQRSRSVGTGGMDAALAPMAVPGTTVSGMVTAVSGNVISLANGLVTIDATNAKIADDHGSTGSIASITTGTTIFAILSTSTPAANAPLPASVIAVHRLAQVELSGPVQSTTASTLTVLGRTITVDANTSFGGHVKALSDILPNDIVAVEANAVGGTLIAASVLDFPTIVNMPKLIHGTVKSIGTTSWTITDTAGKDWTVVINAQTKIIGDPKAGDSVEILVNTDNANQLVAVSIMKSPAVLPFVFFSGQVKSIGTTSWVITKGNKDITVAVNADTRIIGAPAVNDTVTVTANVDSAGNYTATSIMKLGVTPPMTLSGIVKSITGLLTPCAAPPAACVIANWVIGPPAGMMGPAFQVQQTTATTVTGNPTVGDRVTVVAQMSTGSMMTLVAVSITKQ